MTEARLIQLFRVRLQDVRRCCGPMRITLLDAKASLFPALRSYAFFSTGCTLRTPAVVRTPVIAFASKYKTAPDDRIEAVLLHEFGHAMDFLVPTSRLPGLPACWKADPHARRQGTERRADALAEALWGVKIRYDTDTVQSLCSGCYPRPLALGV